MKTKTTNQRVVFGRCKNLYRNQGTILITKKFFFIRILTILVIALVMSGNSFAQLQLPVDLGTAGNYAILAKSGISTVPPSAITGDIGVSPIDQTAITGFSLTMDPSGVFATSTQVTGKVYSADYTSPTPSNLTTAVGDMETAYNDAAGRLNPDFNELGAGEIGGLTLGPGLYKWSTDVMITTDVTINGNSNDVWIFQIAGGCNLANGKMINLTGGALSKNIFWQCAGIVSIGTTAHFEGIALAQTSISLGTNASVNGILLSQTAVTLDANAVTEPSGITGVETDFTPQVSALLQNYPNPFNPKTNISFVLQQSQKVEIKIFDILGNEISTLINEFRNAGENHIEFDAQYLVSGTYIYRIKTDGFIQSKKMQIIK